MKNQKITFKSSKDFGTFLGLSEIEINLVGQKKKIIEKIKKSRISLGLSQAELANLLGTKQPAIARMESGLINEVGLDFLAKAALALGISFTIKANKAA